MIAVPLACVLAAAGAHELRVGGRVFAGAFLDRAPTDDGDRLRLAVSSARVEVRHGWCAVETVVEAELRDGVALRDAHVAATLGSLRARAGRFKEPLSATETSSAWTLPLVDRGLLHELLVDGLLVGGRRSGVELSLRAPRGLRPGVWLAVVQGEVGDDALATRPEHVTLAARAQLGGRALALGIFGERRAAPAPTGGVTHLLAGGADLVASLRMPGGALRAWLDGHVGSSGSRGDPGGAEVRFAAARLVAAWRVGGERGGDGYLELFARGDLYDDDVTVRGDWIAELAGGVNLGRWRRVRLGAEAALRRKGASAPAFVAVGTEPLAIADGLSLRLQAGVAF